MIIRKILENKLKRLIDLGGAALLLVVLSPLFLMIALSIKFDDGGPIFYRRRVASQEGEFDAFKFRTMVPDAEAVLSANRELRE
ncbi:MAG TPA: sugar transferase, partial [Terriglobia bacterium]|nr:sugar transferase [Terriglobia bacterium]